MTNFHNLFIISGFAFLAALPLGILGIRLSGGFSSIYPYAAVSILVSRLYICSLRRLLAVLGIVAAFGIGMSYLAYDEYRVRSSAEHPH